jgi:hypothetical protein
LRRRRGGLRQDTEGFHGYLRVGAGTSTSGLRGPQSCYGLRAPNSSIGLVEEPFSGGNISLGCQKKIDGFALLVDDRTSSAEAPRVAGRSQTYGMGIPHQPTLVDPDISPPTYARRE